MKAGSAPFKIAANVEKIFLSPKFFAVLGLWQLFGIMSIGYPLIVAPYSAGLLLFFFLLFKDRQSLPRRDSFEAEWMPLASPELGKEVTLVLELRLLEQRKIQIRQIRLESPEVEALEFKEIFADFSPVSEGGLRASLIGNARALGFYELGTARILLRSAYGFFEKSIELKTPLLDFRVSPSLKEVPEQVFQETIRNQPLLFQGSRRLMRSSAADQFYSSRKYQYPDSIRHIDQKKSAKYQQLMTRTFEAQYNHHLVILLDLGRTLFGQVRGSEKHDYYLSVALSLAEQAIKARDTVSVLAFSQELHFSLRQTRNIAPLSILRRGDSRLKPRDVESDYALIPEIMPQVSSQRSIVLLLSDLSKPSVQEGLLKNLQPVCRRHLTVCLGLTTKEQDLRSTIECERQTPLSQEQFSQIFYSYWLERRFARFSAEFSQSGGAAILLAEQYWMNAAQRIYARLRASLNA